MTSNAATSEFVDLFTTYTAGPTSIGAHLADLVAAGCAGDPLVVVTSTDIGYFPPGAPPLIEPYRLSTRGFKELAAVSHLGLALPTLARLRELDESGSWRADAQRLLVACKATRSANSVALWRDVIAVPAFAGRESDIAAMVTYSCAVSERVLTRALDNPDWFTLSALERCFLDGPDAEIPVPFNRIMVATFFLVGLDLAHRLVHWFDAVEVPWERAMVIVAGQSGRPTAGVTRESHSVAGVLSAASRGRMAEDRIYIAPHAAVFPAYDGTNLHEIAAFEHGYRRLWASLRATSDLGARMFSAYPRYAPHSPRPVPIDSGATTVHEKPAITGPDDWLALITRLRVLMEDPRQLLSGAVTDYASRQLIENGNDPRTVTVPGLDGERYPHLDEELP